MDNVETNPYLDRLLKLHEEKLKRFRLSLTLLLLGTTVFFFLIFFPYMTLLGNRADCQAKQQQCTQLEQSVLEERFSEVTTTWGKIPLSTAEGVVFFPVGIALGFIATASQLQGLIRLRRAITQQVKGLNSSVDATLIAPLLIDPKRPLVEQAAGGMTLLFPAVVFGYSVIKILARLGVIRSSLPYFHNWKFYYSIYFLSALLVSYGLVKILSIFFKSEGSA